MHPHCIFILSNSFLRFPYNFPHSQLLKAGRSITIIKTVENKGLSGLLMSIPPIQLLPSALKERSHLNTKLVELVTDLQTIIRFYMPERDKILGVFPSTILVIIMLRYLL